jgi:hypothetical protein
VWGFVHEPQALLVFDNCVVNNGAMLITECPDAPPTKCLLFGDSFTGQMLSFLAASFRRFVFVHLPIVDYELVARESPDVVISVLNERFMVIVPNDVTGKGFREQQREKLNAGMVRSRTTTWPEALDPNRAGAVGASDGSTMAPGGSPERA